MPTAVGHVPTVDEVNELIATLYAVVDKLEVVLAEIAPKLRQEDIDNGGAND